MNPMSPVLRIAGFLAVFVASSAALLAGTVTIKGSDTMVILGQKWAEEFMRTHPDTKIQVTGGGSGTGIAALQNRQTDIASSSRGIRAKEREQCIKAFGRNPKEYAVALDGLSIFVHSSNPLESVCLEDLRDIFTGRITRWNEIGGPDAPIIVYSRENSSGTYEFFKEHVLLGRDFAARTQTLAGTAQVIQQVTEDPNGIGYGGAAFGTGTRILSIAPSRGAPAIAPTEESVVAQRYPMWRQLYVYLNPQQETGEIRQFLEWVRSPAGQAIVRAVGYYPLPPNLLRRR
ncbi:MAG: phosphate ABC transporter substrate-binding protein [Limisphaerales bacterium]